MELTKNALKVMYALYKEYLERCKSDDVSSSDARRFYNSHEIHEHLLPKISFDDVEMACRELKNAGLVSVSWYNNQAYNIELSASCIAHMENRFKHGVLDFANFAKELISFIP